MSFLEQISITIIYIYIYDFWRIFLSNICKLYYLPSGRSSGNLPVASGMRTFSYPLTQITYGLDLQGKLFTSGSLTQTTYGLDLRALLTTGWVMAKLSTNAQIDGQPFVQSSLTISLAVCLSRRGAREHKHSLHNQYLRYAILFPWYHRLPMHVDRALKVVNLCHLQTQKQNLVFCTPSRRSSGNLPEASGMQ